MQSITKRNSSLYQFPEHNIVWNTVREVKWSIKKGIVPYNTEYCTLFSPEKISKILPQSLFFQNLENVIPSIISHMAERFLLRYCTPFQYWSIPSALCFYDEYALQFQLFLRGRKFENPVQWKKDIFNLWLLLDLKTLWPLQQQF